MALVFVQVISKKEPLYFALALQKLYSRKSVKFVILSGNLLLRENSYHIANCLKSFNFELFFVCQLKFSMGSLVHLHTMFLYLEKSMTYFRAY